MKPIWIIGLDAGGREMLAPSLLRQIMQADVLFGGKRHLSYFADSPAHKVPIQTKIDEVVMALKQAQQNEDQAVILASGDPLCYGIGAALRRYFPAEQLHIVPAPTAFQLAFAALGEPWSEAALLSAHARPVEQILSQILAASKAAILTDDHHTPPYIAEALIQAGADPESQCAVCENLGGTEQSVIRSTLLAVQNQTFAKLNVFVVWVKAANAIKQHQTLPQPPGLPDEAFSTSAGQITKREVRLLSLAELALQPDEVLWDIGAGSGAVGIEAGRSQPRAQVYAIEKRLTLCQHIRENLSRFPTPNFHLTEGVAPNMVTDWPDPQAVFIGGSGGHLADLIQVAQRRLHSAGRLVINLATLENLHFVQTLLPEARITQVQINRGKPILASLRFEALNPVFIVTWRKK